MLIRAGDKITNSILQFDAVFLCDIHSPLRNQLVKFCYSNGIRTYITPKISDIIIRSSESIHLFDTPLLLSRNNGFSFEQKLVKRIMDIVISIHHVSGYFARYVYCGSSN